MAKKRERERAWKENYKWISLNSALPHPKILSKEYFRGCWQSCSGNNYDRTFPLFIYCEYYSPGIVIFLVSNGQVESEIIWMLGNLTVSSRILETGDISLFVFYITLFCFFLSIFTCFFFTCLFFCFFIGGLLDSFFHFLFVCLFLSFSFK